MDRIEPLSLEHQPILKSRFQEMAMCLSEYSFTSRYLFRHVYDFQVIFDQDLIWLKGRAKDQVEFLMPTTDLRKLNQDELISKLRWADCFYPIPETWLPHFDSKQFQSSYNRDDSDYLFARNKISDFPGRNLSPKRNLLKQFLAANNPHVVPYTQEHYSNALSVLEAWQSPLVGQKTDYEACKEGLTLADQLDLKGYMVYVDENPAAFVLGQFYSPKQLFVIHFAKARTQYKGIYPYLFKELASHLESQQICCLNWEQDLGQEGLRQSKLSYQPDMIAHKYRIGIVS